MGVERGLCGAGASDEMSAGASVATTDIRSSANRRREDVPAHRKLRPRRKLRPPAVTARRTAAVPRTFPRQAEVIAGDEC